MGVSEKDSVSRQRETYQSGAGTAYNSFAGQMASCRSAGLTNYQLQQHFDVVTDIERDLVENGELRSTAENIWQDKGIPINVTRWALLPRNNEKTTTRSRRLTSKGEVRKLFLPVSAGANGGLLSALIGAL